MCRERIASMPGLVVSTIGIGKTCISAIRRYIFDNFKAFQVKPFEYVNIQFHRVVGLRALTGLSLREIIKPPQLHESMTSKLFKYYRSMFA